MTPFETQLDAAARLAIAALVGLGVGLEREWSGHASGPNARFAGLRTFLVLGIVGGVGGLFVSSGMPVAGAAMVAGGMAIAVAAYVTAARRPNLELDGTTEAAALAVVALGALAGTGVLGLAAGAGSVVVLALSEKARLHWLVSKLGEHELRGALQFAVLSLVILPLLPTGPYGGALEIRPRSLWTIVLFFSALNYAGYVARRAAGPGAGYTLAGMLGGLISSTAVTLDFSRKSRDEQSLGVPLAYGVIGACTVLIPRVLAVSSVLNADVGVEVFWLLGLPMVAGAAILVMGWRRASRGGPQTTEQQDREPQSPLRLRNAIQMTLAFQVAVSAIGFIHRQWGSTGLYSTAVMLGLTDLDALTVSVSRPDAAIPAALAGRAIALGVLSNSIAKIALIVGLGTGQFRKVALLGLVALAAGTILGLVLVGLYAPG